MDTFVVSVCALDPDSSDFGDVCALYAPFLHQLTMQSSLFERGCPLLVVVCVARKLRPCPSYSRRRDHINLGLWCSLYKGVAGYNLFFNIFASAHISQANFLGQLGGNLDRRREEMVCYQVVTRFTVLSTAVSANSVGCCHT